MGRVCTQPQSVLFGAHVLKADFASGDSSPEQAGGPLGWWVVASGRVGGGRMGA